MSYWDTSTLVKLYAQELDQCYQQAPRIPLRTLNALHLASARVAGETEFVATDNRMRDSGMSRSRPGSPNIQDRSRTDVLANHKVGVRHPL